MSRTQTQKVALQPLLTPDPLHPVVIEGSALETKPPVQKSPAQAQMPVGQLVDHRRSFWTSIAVTATERLRVFRF